MGRIYIRTAMAMVPILASSAVQAATPEEALSTVTMLMLYAAIAFVLVAAVAVYFMKSRDLRLAPLHRVFEKGETIHAASPDTSVAECVRTMTANRVGALVIMDGSTLKGIFTERDALNKVLATGLDPSSTKVA